MKQTFKILVGFGALAITGALFLRSNKAFGNLPFVNYYGGTEFLENEVRGVRNNNPGNIRISQANWKGKIPLNLNTDGTFEQFINYTYGVRALIILLRTYYYKYKLRTVYDIIARFAPANENNTYNYIIKVAKQLGLEPKEKFILDKKIFWALVQAIDFIENGKNTITYKTYMQATYLI